MFTHSRTSEIQRRKTNWWYLVYFIWLAKSSFLCDISYTGHVFKNFKHCRSCPSWLHMDWSNTQHTEASPPCSIHLGKKMSNSQLFKTNGGGGFNGFLNSDKKLYLYAEGISWRFSVIVGHFEGFLFFKIIFPAKRSCLLRVIHQKAMFYRYNRDILGHFQCILWGIRFLLMQ